MCSYFHFAVSLVLVVRVDLIVRGISVLSFCLEMLCDVTSRTLSSVRCWTRSVLPLFAQTQFRSVSVVLCSLDAVFNGKQATFLQIGYYCYRDRDMVYALSFWDLFSFLCSDVSLEIAICRIWPGLSMIGPDLSPHRLLAGPCFSSGRIAQTYRIWYYNIFLFIHHFFACQILTLQNSYRPWLVAKVNFSCFTVYALIRITLCFFPPYSFRMSTFPLLCNEELFQLLESHALALWVDKCFV